jgi:hypothetical protein
MGMPFSGVPLQMTTVPSIIPYAQTISGQIFTNSMMEALTYDWPKSYSNIWLRLESLDDKYYKPRHN